MEKTITLTSDEISSITLAIYDKVMNLSQAVLICGAAWAESITEPRPITANDVLAAAVIKKILRY